MAENELQHEGILGMKWGKRRWQYPDGSLTPAGRKRYGVGPPRETKTVTETTVKKSADGKTNETSSKTTTTETSGDGSTETTVVKKTDGSEETTTKTTSSSGSNKPKTREEEMQEYIKRRNTEKTYQKLKKEEEEADNKYIQAKKSLDEAAKLVEQAKKQNAEYVKKHTIKEKLDLSGMTDQDLRDKITRANLEKQYRDLFAKDQVNITKGRQIISNILEYAGPAIATAGSAVTLAMLINQFREGKK